MVPLLSNHVNFCDDYYYKTSKNQISELFTGDMSKTTIHQEGENVQGNRVECDNPSFFFLSCEVYQVIRARLSKTKLVS